MWKNNWHCEQKENPRTQFKIFEKSLWREQKERKDTKRA